MAKKTVRRSTLGGNQTPLKSGQVLSVRGKRPNDPVPEDKAEAFMQLARSRFKLAHSATATLRANMRQDKEFHAAKQWDPAHMASRMIDSRPCLTANLLPAITRQITNAGRMAQPAIQINPVDDEGDIFTAEVLQGMIRQIETKSDATTAYVTAQDNQAQAGLGYLRLVSEYEDEESWNQVLRIKRVPNIFTVYLDPLAEELDRRDAKFGFITSRIQMEEYKALYPDAAVSSLTLAAQNHDLNLWFPSGGVLIAEYYYLDEVRDEIMEIEVPQGSGQTSVIVTLSAAAVKVKQAESMGVVIRDRRWTVRKQVKWAKINAVEVLEGSEDLKEGRVWGGSRIPIFPVIGEEVNIDGVVDLKGVTRDAKEICRMINFWISEIAYAIGTAPKSPYIAEAGMIEPYMSIWQNMNRVATPVLPYKAKTLDGRLVERPHRETAEVPIQAMVQGLSIAMNLLKDVTGLHQANLGEQGNERSGVAIAERKQQGDLSTSHYGDGLSRAIKSLGECLVEVIPIYYDAQRVLRITTSAEEMRKVMVYSGQDNAPSDPEAEKQRQSLYGIYDLSAGKYDVTVSVGQRYETKRKEAVAAMVDLTRAYPQAFPLMGDLIVKNMDWAGAQEVAERLELLLPPGAKPKNGQLPIPPQVQQEMQQLQGQLQQLSQLYQQAQNIISTDAQKLAAQTQMKQIEAESRERVAAIQAQVEIATTAAKLNEERAQTILQAEMEKIKIKMEMQEAARQARQDRQDKEAQEEGDNG